MTTSGTLDLSSYVYSQSALDLAANVYIYGVDNIFNLLASVHSYDVNDIFATVSSTGNYTNLTASILYTTQIATLTASISYNMSYTTTIFPVNTLMHRDLTATVGIICCEGGSTYLDLVASYILFDVFDLSASVTLIRYPLTFDLTASVNTGAKTLDVLNIKITPSVVTRREGARTVDGFNIRIVPDRYLELPVTVIVILPSIDLTAQVTVVRMPVYRKEHSTRAEDYGFSVEIDYVNLKYPNFKRTVRFAFDGGDIEFYFNSLTSSVIRSTENKWKILAVAFEKTDKFTNIKKRKVKTLDDISIYTTVDEAIRSAIVEAVGELYNDLTANVEVSGGILSLSVLVFSTPEDKTAEISAEVIVVT